MRLLTLCAAMFCLVTCAGSFVILYVLPDTAMAWPWQSIPGRQPLSFAIRAWVVPSLLVFGVVADAAILVSLWNPRSLSLPRTTTALALVTVALSVVEFLLARADETVPQVGIPWANVSLIAASGLYLLAGRSSTTARGRDAL